MTRPFGREADETIAAVVERGTFHIASDRLVAHRIHAGSCNPVIGREVSTTRWTDDQPLLNSAEHLLMPR